MAGKGDTMNPNERHLCSCSRVAIGDCAECYDFVCVQCDNNGLCPDCFEARNDSKNTKNEDTDPAALIGEPASEE